MSRPLFDDLDDIGRQVDVAPFVQLFLDFDGTLTPLVDRPEAAVLAPSTRDLLQGLAQCKSVTLAVISGRRLADLEVRVRVPGAIYAGNHGLEIQGLGLAFVQPAALVHRSALNQLALELSRRLQTIPGACVEHKGLTLSVHYRRTARRAHADVRRIVHAVLGRTSRPVMLTSGHQVYEVRPSICWDKGAAVDWIREQLAQADALPIYLGDDVTDEDAFDALDDGVTVRVGLAGDTAAQYYVESPAEVQRFLEWLASRVGAGVAALSR